MVWPFGLSAAMTATNPLVAQTLALYVNRTPGESWIGTHDRAWIACDWLKRNGDFLPAVAPPLMREHRLYQADWLLRFYQFQVSELAYGDDGNLDLEIDPKLAWALANRHVFPLDVNKASKELLLRIPGVGVRSVERILQARKFRRLKLHDLRLMRLSLPKVAPFVLTADRNPGAAQLDSLDLRTKVIQPVQLSFFDAGVSAKTGEV